MRVISRLGAMTTPHQPFDVHPDVELPVPAPDELWTAGAVILNDDGAAFAQKRSPHRSLFPDSWDIVGGHVEAGETLLEALAREVEEETGWRLRYVRGFLGTTTWTGDDGAQLRHEADFLVEVEGDLDAPRWSGANTPPTDGSVPPTSTASRRTGSPENS